MNPTHKHGECGVVLLVALLAIALLTIAVMEFTFSTQTDYRRAVHWQQAERAALMARSGIDLAVEILEQSDLLHRMLLGSEKRADGLDELWAQLCAPQDRDSCPSDLPPSCAIDTGSGTLAVRINDESGLYNLNRLRDAGEPASERERDVFARVCAAAGVDPTVIGPLTDWIDRDDRPYGYGPGAESAIYGGVDLPYPQRNGPLATFGEVALVAGIGIPELARLRRLTTVLDPASVTTVNVNTAPLALLAALDPEVPPLLAQLAEERCLAPFVDIDDLRQRIAGWPRWLGDRWLHFRSAWFRVRASAAVGDVRQSVEAVVHRTDDSARVVYYLKRRGVIVPAMEASEAADLAEIQSHASSARELP